MTDQFYSEEKSRKNSSKTNQYIDPDYMSHSNHDYSLQDTSGKNYQDG